MKRLRTTIALSVLTAAATVTIPAYAGEKSDPAGESFQRVPPRDISKAFPVIEEWTAPGLGVAVKGISFLEDDHTVAERKTLTAPSIPQEAEPREQLLFWMSAARHTGTEAPGLVVGKNGEPGAVLNPRHIAWESGVSGVHACLAPLDAGVANMALAVSAPPAVPDASGRFVACGVARVTVYAEKNVRAERRVRVRLGAKRLGAHDRASIRLESSPGARLRSVVVAGGHGRAGNGSAILLNGVAVSGKEAWRSSAGHLFDVHAYDLSPAMALPTTLEFDTVLQAVFPGLVITSEELP